MLPSIIKKGGKVLLWIFGSVLLLLIIFFIFIQTDTFNKYALEYTLNELNSSQQPKNNKINAESIEGNIFSGIKLNKGSVSVKEDTLLSFNFLSVKYDLWGLLDKRIMLHEIILSDPVINASKIRSGDSLIWNFENLFSSNEKDTTASEPFDWDVNVENFKIENGFFRVAGDTVSPKSRWKEKRTLMQMFNFNQTDISDLNLELSAKYYKDFKSISIKNISFNTNSDFSLKKLKLDVNLNEKDTTTDLWNFELVTNKTDINIYRLYVEKFNPFNPFVYEDLGDKQVNISIDIKKFNFDDLTFFLPELNFLDSTVGVKLEATGKYNDLNAETIRVRLTNSTINFRGNIKNLQKPDSLYFDVYGDDITINSKDIKSVYKGDLPDFDALGTINADLHYKGTYSVFYSEFTLNTDAGYADGVLNLDIPNEIYSGYINTRVLNPGRVLNNKNLYGSLNLSAKFDGSGFELNKMNTNLVYSMTSSRIGKYDVKYSAGTVHAVRGNLTMNIRHASSMGNVNVNGTANISNMKNPVYNLKGNVQGLNIAAITGSSSDKSNLNFAFNVNGRGYSPENINGVYKLDINESFYGKYDIPQTPVDAEIHSSNSNGTIKLSTDMVDLDAKGSFKLDKLIDVILYNITQVQEQIAQSTGTTGLLTDSSKIYNTSSLNTNYNTSDLNFEYKLVTKDSTKLHRVLQPFGVNFNGNVSGNIANTSGKFTSLTKLDIKNFNMQDTVIVVKDFKGDIVFNNEYSGGINGVDIKLNAAGDQLSFGSTKLDSIITKYNMHGSDADIVFRAGMDTSVNTIVQGKLNFSDGSIKADLDTVLLTYGGYNIENKGNWVLSFEEADRMKFEKFDIKSRNAILNVSGVLSLKNESDLKIEGNNLKITDIASIVNQADSSYIISADNDIEGEITKILVSYKGTFEEPVLTSEISTNTLKYMDTDIGVLTTKFDYKDNTADANVIMKNADGKGSLILKGTIPFQNPLSGDTTAAFDISSAPVDINFKADNFVLDYFSVLISDAASLKGVLNADLSAKGTSSDPALSGNLKITKGGYLLPLTGMYYSFEANMSTDNFNLVLDNLKLYNEDDDARHIDLYGSLDFKDLKIKDINLEARGDMVLLDKDVVQNDMGVYGYIYAGIGTPPVKITGSLDSLFVSGQLLIKEATISSVPLQGNGYSIEDDNFVYLNKGNDSINYKPDSLIVINLEEFNRLNPFEKFMYKVSGDTLKQTFVNLDLNVKTENTIYASMDFNNVTRDRLFGELNADLDIKTVDGKMQAFGTVNVEGDSYYRFYRDFKLNESMVKFDGDISNPYLDIKGVYTSEMNNEQYGTVTTSTVEVIVFVKGYVNNPELKLAPYIDGSEVTGDDAQSEAVTYLLFGRFKKDLSPSERSAVASSLGTSVGSLYASAYLSKTIREILPFIVDAQFTYTDGDVKNTDVEFISDLGDARVKYGGKLFKDVKNFEIVIDYPVNRLLNLKLPEKLMLEFARQEKDQTLSTNQNDVLTTEIKLLYKIKF